MKKASDGYFLAKRQMQDALSGRISTLEKEIEDFRKVGNKKAVDSLNIRINELEMTRSYVRNVLLWDKTNEE